MRKYLIASLLISALLPACTREYDCVDPQIPFTFVRFAPSDIDTLVFKRYKEKDSYRQLLDSFLVVYGRQTQYLSTNDSTTIWVTDGKNGIKAGFDWIIDIPARNRQVAVSGIESERKRGRRNYGIFSLDPAPDCTNRVFSLMVDNNRINILPSDSLKQWICVFN